MESRYHRKVLNVFIVLFSMLCYSCSNGKEEIFIPSTYCGPVVIFYNQNFMKGFSDKRGQNLTIKVPDDGIVFTKFIKPDGEFIIRFSDEYYKDKLIRAPRTGSIYLDKEIPYFIFYVGNNLELEEIEGLEYADLKLIYESNVK